MCKRGREAETTEERERDMDECGRLRGERRVKKEERATENRVAFSFQIGGGM